jgi:hypothetical protein
MENSRVSKRVMAEKMYTSRRRGRPKVRWLDDVQEDLRVMGIEGWRGKAQDRNLWRRKAQEVKAHEGLHSQVVVVGTNKNLTSFCFISTKKLMKMPQRSLQIFMVSLHYVMVNSVPCVNSKVCH